MKKQRKKLPSQRKSNTSDKEIACAVFFGFAQKALNTKT
ncbi:hypothetical protein D051_0723 [Vibrio parahaemolyticus VPCR-2010]|nr:hypothetical protein D051_0723 [Vibrio parahaemolyticus VPCR-2010]